FLDDEPIRARRSSLVERLGRWCRRNPAVASLVAVIQVSLLGLLVMAWWSNGRVNEALKEKETERSNAVASRDAALAETYRALVNETQALRLARPPGWRHTAFQNLHRLPEIDTPQKDLIEFRSEAAACLGGGDVLPSAAFRGHSKEPSASYSIGSVQFSPDGKLLASADWTGQVLIREAADGRVIAQKPSALRPRDRRFSPQDHLPAVRFHPGGNWLACANSGPGVD